MDVSMFNLYQSPFIKELCIKILENGQILIVKYLDFFFTNKSFMAKNIIFLIKVLWQI